MKMTKEDIVEVLSNEVMSNMRKVARSKRTIAPFELPVDIQVHVELIAEKIFEHTETK